MNTFKHKEHSASLVCRMLIAALLLSSLAACTSRKDNLSGDRISAEDQTGEKYYISEVNTISEEEAFDLLIESISFDEETLSFTIPDVDTPSELWNVNLRGHLHFYDGSDADNLHYFDIVKWTRGETYRAQVGSSALHFTKLFLDVTLGDHQRSIDVLPYVRVESGWNGRDQSERPPYASEEMKSSEPSSVYRAYLQGILEDFDNGIILGRKLSDPELSKEFDFLYSISDVNGDGLDEVLLITRWNGYERNLDVLGYRTNEAGLPYFISLLQTSCFISRFDGHSNPIFYKNGVIKSDWLHNQNFIQGDVWPYDLYDFDFDIGIYKQIASATSWKRELWDRDFPKDVDRDRDGEIYCVAAESPFDLDLDGRTAGQWCDGAEYREWLASMIGDGEAIELEYEPLTSEALGFG